MVWDRILFYFYSGPGLGQGWIFFFCGSGSKNSVLCHPLLTTVLFRDMVCTTLDMDQTTERKELTLDISNKILDKHV